MSAGEKCPTDLACIIDAEGPRAAAGQRIMQGGEDAAAQEEAVVEGAAGVGVIPDHLACIVDAVYKGAAAVGVGVLERGEVALAREEAMKSAGVFVIPDDLVRGVDAQG